MAKITSTTELLTTIADLETATSLPQGTVSSKMDAIEINELMTGIEDAFNKLYEKLRLLEDLHDFTKRYIQNEFKKCSVAFGRASKEIDSTSDLHQNIIAQSLTTNFSTGIVVTDRDGVAIPTADYIDGTTLIPASTTIQAPTPESVVVQSSGVPYRRNLTPAENYKAFYANEQPPAEPVTETIDFIYLKEEELNFFDITAFNANIEKMTVTSAKEEKTEIDVKSHMHKRILAKRLSMILRSTKNEMQDVTVNFNGTKKESGGQYLDGIKDTIYETMIRNNGGTTYES